ncbi:hypothetical protein SAMN05660816_03844 [Niastella yeongjuensis]|nr:hypothetical protein SAMN05660816_03844 [Niastella yeongjuensis]
MDPKYKNPDVIASRWNNPPQYPAHFYMVILLLHHARPFYIIKFREIPLQVIVA